MTVVVPATLLADRLRRAQEELAARGFDIMLVTPGSDLRYLLGVHGFPHAQERLVCFVLPAAGHRAKPTLVVPATEAGGLAPFPLEKIGVEVLPWRDHLEDPYLLVSDVAGAPTTVGVINALPARHLFGLESALPGTTTALAGSVVRELRLRKDAAEIDQLRTAAAAVDRVHSRMNQFVSEGLSESRALTCIATAMKDEGHDEIQQVLIKSASGEVTVASRDVADRVFGAGDVLTVSVAGRLSSGYCSSCTRTYVVGEAVPAKVRSAVAVLRHARESATGAIRSGSTTELVKTEIQEMIAAAGFSLETTNVLVNGIGLDFYEEPGHIDENLVELAPDMTLSLQVELNVDEQLSVGFGDVVVVTTSGCELLNTATPELVTLSPAPNSQ